MFFKKSLSLLIASLVVFNLVGCGRLSPDAATDTEAARGETLDGKIALIWGKPISQKTADNQPLTCWYKTEFPADAKGLDKGIAASKNAVALAGGKPVDTRDIEKTLDPIMGNTTGKHAIDASQGTVLWFVAGSAIGEVMPIVADFIAKHQHVWIVRKVSVFGAWIGSKLATLLSKLPNKSGGGGLIASGVAKISKGAGWLLQKASTAGGTLVIMTALAGVAVKDGQHAQAAAKSQGNDVSQFEPLSDGVFATPFTLLEKGINSKDVKHYNHACPKPSEAASQLWLK